MTIYFLYHRVVFNFLNCFLIVVFRPQAPFVEQNKHFFHLIRTFVTLGLSSVHCKHVKILRWSLDVALADEGM